MHVFFQYLTLLATLTALMWATHKWNDSVFMISIPLLLAVHGLSAVLAGFRINRANRAMFRQSDQQTIREVQKYTHLTESSVIGANRWALYWGSLVFPLATFIEYNWFGISIWLLSGAYYHYCRQMQIPFVLVLGASSDASKELATLASMVGYPLKSTNLLAVRGRIKPLEILADQTTTRIANEAVSWIVLVRELVKSAKLIIVDIRTMSTFLEEELHIVYELAVSYKTVFVYEQDSSPEYVIRIKRKFGEGALFTSQNAAISIIEQLRKQPALLPAEQTPISSISFAMAKS